MVLETAEREGNGTRVVVTGGQMAAVEECARRTGTTVAVRSLFFNVPARAKFLRTTAAENRAIGEVITTQALASPSIAFSLDSGTRDVLNLPAAGSVAERVAALWGNDAADDLLPVAHRSGAVGITGLIQRPNAARPGGRRTYLFVNGRAFTDRYLVRAADRAYKTTIAPGIHPHLFLFLQVPDGEVDVNVHPAKAEVRFRDRVGIERLVEEGVRAALAGLESTPSIGMRGVAADEREPAPLPPQSGSGMMMLREQPQTRFNAHLHTAPASAAGTPEDPASQMTLFVAGGGPVPANGAEGGTAAGVPPEMFAGAAPVMWQVHNTYILAETRSGLVLVDQHSAHERVLYEEIVRQFDTGAADSQRLLFPLTLRLSPAEYALVEQIQGVLERAGFEVEPFGGRSIIVHAVPNPHPYFDAERCLREMIAELADGSPLVDSARTQHQRIALSMACKGAIKAGQKLSQQEMTELFDRLFATELPYHDIHGRPTVIQLSLTELHRRFGRSG
jgi:DNA mismatch repair protein MutL